MGIITQTNKQYYTGSYTTSSNTSLSEIVADFGVELRDSSNGPNGLSNYKVFVDPTGSGFVDNFIEYPKSTENAISTGVDNLSLWSIPAGIIAAPGIYYVSPVSATQGSGCILQIIIDASGLISGINLHNGGEDYLDGDILTIPTSALSPGSVQFEITLSPSLLYTGSTYSVNANGNNTITFQGNGIPGPISPYTKIVVKVQLTQGAIWDQYGDYEYIKLSDVVDNFIVGYTGEGKLLENVKRSDIIFHAKRGLQEFSYDTLRSVKSQELSLTPVNTAVIPQDYINYVQFSWVDSTGVKHPIYPTQLTSDPTNPLIQGGDGLPVQDSFGQNTEPAMSTTADRWAKNQNRDINGLLSIEDYNANVYNWTWWDQAWGQRYGADPETSNFNGWFTIDRRRNVFSFSSNLKGKLIIVEYISDGLAYDEDTKIPKMAEQAMYMHIAHALVSTRPNIQEYIVRRFKVDRRAALRNAKIRLQNIKLNEFVQVMRGKSKWIKH